MLDAVARHGGLDLDVRVEGDLETGAAPHRRGHRDRRSARRSTRRSATARASAASATPSCRWTRRARAARSTSRAGPSWSSRAPIPTRGVADFDTDLAEEFLRAVASTAKLTVHVRVEAGANAHHMVEAAFKAFARALRGRSSDRPGRDRHARPRRACCEPRVAILDYGMGNLRSVEKALEHVGADVGAHARPRARARGRRRRAARRGRVSARRWRTCARSGSTS